MMAASKPSPAATVGGKAAPRTVPGASVIPEAHGAWPRRSTSQLSSDAKSVTMTSGNGTKSSGKAAGASKSPSPLPGRKSLPGFSNALDSPPSNETPGRDVAGAANQASDAAVTEAAGRSKVCSVSESAHAQHKASRSSSERGSNGKLSDAAGAGASADAGGVDADASGSARYGRAPSGAPYRSRRTGRAGSSRDNRSPNTNGSRRRAVRGPTDRGHSNSNGTGSSNNGTLHAGNGNAPGGGGPAAAVTVPPQVNHAARYIPGFVMHNGPMMSPGMTGNPAMHARVNTLLSHLQCNAESERRRQALFDQIKVLLSDCAMQINCFGSWPLKTYLPDSDMDLMLVLTPEQQDATTPWWDAVLAVLRAHERRSPSPGTDPAQKASTSPQQGTTVGAVPTAAAAGSASSAAATSAAKLHIKRDDQMLVPSEGLARGELVVRDIVFVNAEVKVIKVTMNDLRVDICANQLEGMYALLFLEEVNRDIGRNHLFKRSLILLKAWALYESGILASYRFLLSTYALEIMMVHVFNVYGTWITTPLEALFRFLTHFAQFRWDLHALTVFGSVELSAVRAAGGELPPSAMPRPAAQALLSESLLQRFAYRAPNHHVFAVKHLNIIDPLNPINNLGRSVSLANSYKVQREIERAAGRMAALLSSPAATIVSLDQFFENAWKARRNPLPQPLSLDLRQRSWSDSPPRTAPSSSLGHGAVFTPVHHQRGNGVHHTTPPPAASASSIFDELDRDHDDSADAAASGPAVVLDPAAASSSAVRPRSSTLPSTPTPQDAPATAANGATNGHGCAGTPSSLGNNINSNNSSGSSGSGGSDDGAVVESTSSPRLVPTPSPNGSPSLLVPAEPYLPTPLMLSPAIVAPPSFLFEIRALSGDLNQMNADLRTSEQVLGLDPSPAAAASESTSAAAPASTATAATMMSPQYPAQIVTSSADAAAVDPMMLSAAAMMMHGNGAVAQPAGVWYVGAAMHQLQQQHLQQLQQQHQHYAAAAAAVAAANASSAAPATPTSSRKPRSGNRRNNRRQSPGTPKHSAEPHEAGVSAASPPSAADIAAAPAVSSSGSKDSGVSSASDTLLADDGHKGSRHDHHHHHHHSHHPHHNPRHHHHSQQPQGRGGKQDGGGEAGGAAGATAAQGNSVKPAWSLVESEFPTLAEATSRSRRSRR